VKPLPHTYQARVQGGPAVHAALSTPGAPDLRAAPPLEFDGPGDAWSPEALLLAAVEACLLFTLQTVAKVAKIPFVSLDLQGEAILDRQDGALRFTEIILRPRLVLPPAADRTRALRVLEKSKRGCLIGAALSTPIRMEPEITSG
jgi:organic hydroperoxide reductase OsmC/OhrA